MPRAPALLGWALSMLNAKVLTVLLGVAGLILCISAGLWLAAWLVGRWYREDENEPAV